MGTLELTPADLQAIKEAAHKLYVESACADVAQSWVQATLNYLQSLQITIKLPDTSNK